jgi:hypothetical protein
MDYSNVVGVRTPEKQTLQGQRIDLKQTKKVKKKVLK